MTTMLPLGRHSDSLWCRAQGSLATASYWGKKIFQRTTMLAICPRFAGAGLTGTVGYRPTRQVCAGLVWLV
jgi:hypothetical protein